MKAIVRDRYGSPNVLRLEEIEKPTFGDDELLVRVEAASVSASDWENLTGAPLYVRLFGGLRKPRIRILGSDFAGCVEAVGRNVKQFRPGDEVLGDTMWCGFGTFAEYISVPQSAPLALKPAQLGFDEAATLPQAAVIAWQGITDKGRAQPGQRVLIVGAGGGAGTFAVQLAKRLGAEVTGVDNSEKSDLLRSLGADHVIDYTREDFTRNRQHYDLILDLAAHRSIFDCRRALRLGGTYLLVGGSMLRLVQVLSLGSLFSMTGSKKMRLLAVSPSSEALATVVREFEARKIVPVIDKRYPLSEVPEAIRTLGEGHARGKVVITL